MLAVAYIFCVSYTDQMVVMFCETQKPKGMVFKTKNFCNNGDKLDPAIGKTAISQFLFWKYVGHLQVKTREMPFPPKLAKVLRKILAA